MALNDWEQNVQQGVVPLAELEQLVMDDLDEAAGGIGWWVGMLDWKRSVLLADYLLQSIDGAAASLQRASYAAGEHRRVVAALDYEAVQKVRRGEMPYEGQSAMGRQQVARREMTIEQVFYHLCQCLDRLAAAVLVVGAVNRDVAKAAWTQIEDLQKTAREKSSTLTLRKRIKEQLEPTGTPGRALQEELLLSVADHEEFGPPDWLPWMLETRHTFTHRGESTRLVILKGRPGRPEGLHRGLPRTPKRSDVESFGLQPPTRQSLEQLLLPKGTPETLEGLVDSTSGLAGQLAQAMQTCWVARRENPTLLIQHGKQWSKVEHVEPMRFEGYGPKVALLLGDGASVRVSPSTGKRMRAARILDVDAGRSPWTTEHE